MKKCILSVMIAALMIGVAGCGENASASGNTEVLAQEINPVAEEQLRNEIGQSMEDYDVELMQEGYLDYSMRLFAGSVEEESNSMISPVSVMIALDMAAAGANGETQSQITDLFCEGASQEQVEHFCRDLLDRYEESQDVELHLANSIWIRDGFGDQINEDYLVRMDTIFDAEAVMAPFDQTTVDAINQWCDDNTDGMIDHLLDEIEPDMELILLNATALDAPWAEPYEDHQVTEETFTNANGDTEDVEMLNGMERVYFETEDAIGFMKYYEGYEYAFLAILPEESMTVDQYVQSLTGEKYLEFWNSRTEEYEVQTKMPEFTYEYELVMNDVLNDMGMIQAFDEKNADFTGITGEPDLYINTVLHKTFIEVGQYRTQAAAVTAVLLQGKGAEIPLDRKQVYLDRPFVYAIVEVDTGMPLFIGTLKSAQ
ncbi:MAG: serpin family protein [Lachnospiraceae bacterium]|nr:serpin family protein [Lachnospiraceae bacterium]